MKRISIVHFEEIEKYPPTINIIRYLHEYAKDDLQIQVLTSQGLLPAVMDIPSIEIHRLSDRRKSTSKLGRFLLYLRFNVKAIIQLIKFSPGVILYFETLSAGPAWFYKTFIQRKTAIYVHYHEYVSKMEYETGMRLSRWLHQREKHLYPQMKWVSHTNADRLQLFLKDVNGNGPTQTYIVPNYPPAAWKQVKCSPRPQQKIGFVYVGALSLETMYLKEMAEFVKARAEECYWDIYSTNLSQRVSDYFNTIGANNITFKGAVPYDELPKIFCKYNVGLVLYKGHIPNYVYNVPNKLFEYYVCGLDVWFPFTMKSTLPFQTVDTYPKIIAVDFRSLQPLSLRAMTDRNGLREQRIDYSYENVLKPLAASVFGKMN